MVDDHRLELSFKKGEMLIRQGAPLSHIFFIRHGFVKLYMEDGDDKVILNIAKPGTFLGVQALYGQAVSPFSAVAITDTEVCLKDIAVFRELVMQNPKFSSGVIEVLNDGLLHSYQRMFSLTTKQIDGRLSELLLFMSNVMHDSNPFTLSISRGEIADLISTTPESISRLLSDFKDQGIIKVMGRSIEILDANRLKSICRCESLSVY